ncbi:MAG: hypothetical protein Tsb0020_34410 [Haliangiales bacterium]
MPRERLLPCEPARSEPCSCPDDQAGVVVLDAEGESSCLCGTTFERTRAGIPGRWQGTRVLPSTWSDPGGDVVEFVFYADGAYSATCPGQCTALYYGSDADHPSKTYELTDILDNGEGVGRIHVWFGDTSGSVTQGAMEVVALDSSGDRLSFEFWNVWGGRYGPVRYQLDRCQP